MEKVYRNSAALIVLIILLVQWGFYRSYTSQFPNFKDATTIIHIHGALLMTWLVMLVIQPVLIATGRNHLHRKIGKLSWVLGPAIIIVLFLVGRGSFLRFPEFQDKPEGLSTMALDIRGLFSFAIFWGLAMFYRKEHTSHMRYMLSTGLLGIGPGLGRALIYTFKLPIYEGLFITDIITISIVVVLLAIDINKKKNYKPFLIVLLVLLFGAFMWQISSTETWMNFARWYARVFYQW